MNWPKHVEKWRDCQRCPLAQQRFRICLARGALPAVVVFIGEAPGISEDASGQPFVGPAGQLLDRIIEAAMPGVPHIMTNLVACFPRKAKEAGVNEPERGEILECRPRLIELVNIARPRLIVHVGGLAEAHARLGGGVPYVRIDHPAFILRMPLVKQGCLVRDNTIALSKAVQEALESDKEFVTWGANYVEGRSTRDQLREVYGGWGSDWTDPIGPETRPPYGADGGDDVPF